MFQTESLDYVSTKMDNLHTVIVLINPKIALHIQFVTEFINGFNEFSQIH